MSDPLLKAEKLSRKYFRQQDSCLYTRELGSDDIGKRVTRVGPPDNAILTIEFMWFGKSPKNGHRSSGHLVSLDPLIVRSEKNKIHRLSQSCFDGKWIVFWDEIIFDDLPVDPLIEAQFQKLMDRHWTFSRHGGNLFKRALVRVDDYPVPSPDDFQWVDFLIDTPLETEYRCKRRDFGLQLIARPFTVPWPSPKPEKEEKELPTLGKDRLLDSDWPVSFHLDDDVKSYLEECQRNIDENHCRNRIDFHQLLKDVTDQ